MKNEADISDLVKHECYCLSSLMIITLHDVRSPANQPVDSLEWNKNVMNTTHVPNMIAMVAPRNMFGWDSYLDLEVICTAHIGG